MAAAKADFEGDLDPVLRPSESLPLDVSRSYGGLEP